MRTGKKRGAVKSPDLDGRLRKNKLSAFRMTKQRESKPGGQGQVVDPTTDRRLKQNRDTGSQ